MSKTKVAKKILVISNQKGGVAKSTTTAQVGAYAAKKKIRTLLVDLDSQGNLSSKFLTMRNVNDVPGNIAPEPHPETGEIYTARNVFTDDDWLPYPTATPNLWILPACDALRDTSQYSGSARKIAQQTFNTPGLWDEFDLVIIDTPPAKNIYTETAILLATHVLIPCTMEKPSFEGLMAAVQYIHLINAPLSAEDGAKIIGVLPTMYQARFRIHTDYRERLHKNLGAAALDIEVRLRPTYQEIELLSKERPYQIPKTKKAEDAYNEWVALGERVLASMDISK